MTVEFGNIYYFMYIFIAIIITFLIYKILSRLTDENKSKVLMIVAIINLTLHFLKLLFHPYVDDWPSSIRKITFENICAISTMVLPFAMKTKKQIIKNYFYFISFLGGFLALIVPTEALGKSILTFDVNRFYLCHYILFLVPFLTFVFNLYTPSIKLFWSIPLMFLLVKFIILINEYILLKIGFISSDISDFFSSSYRNSSFVFGPLPSFQKICDFILILVPKLFKQNIFNLPISGDFYWPVVWMIFPVMIYFPIIYLGVTLPFTYKNIKNYKKERGKINI